MITPKKLTANSIKNIAVFINEETLPGHRQQGAEAEKGYVLVIKGTTCYTSDDGLTEIETPERFELQLTEEDAQIKGIVNAIINFAERKLKDNADLE